MKFAAQPVNVEGNGGQALRVSIPLSLCPPEGAIYSVWAARLPDALTLPQVQALASGAMDLAAFGLITQHGEMSGLRQGIEQSVIYAASGTDATLECSLYNALADMAPRCENAPSWDVAVNPLKERSDGPWIIAVTAVDALGAASVASGGLAQQEGQQHLAGVFLRPSQYAVQVEVGVWLEKTIRSLKPVLDSVMASVQFGEDLSLKGVLFTDEIIPDEWPYLLVIPQTASDNPDGLAAPDRSEIRLSFTIRGMSYGDNPAQKVRALAQLMGTLEELLNTRKLREAALPSGRTLNLARASSLSFGRTEDSWDQASELSWSCLVVQTGIF